MMSKDEEMQKFLESESEYLRSLADILKTDSDWYGNNVFRNVMIGVIDTMRNRADKIDALLGDARRLPMRDDANRISLLLTKIECIQKGEE